MRRRIIRMVLSALVLTAAVASFAFADCHDDECRGPLPCTYCTHPCCTYAVLSASCSLDTPDGWTCRLLETHATVPQSLPDDIFEPPRTTA